MAGGFQNDTDDLVSGINVTPLVDVVLVLLIIFLITAPVIYQSSIKVQLPQAKSGQDQGKPNPLQFVLTADGQLQWNNKNVNWDSFPLELENYLKSASPDAKESAAVAADKATPHGTVIRLMDVLRQAGIVKFSLTVENKK